MSLVTTLSLITCLRMILNCTNLILLLKHSLFHRPANPAFQMWRSVWVVQNKLQLNDDKTDILLIGSAPGTDLPASLCVGQSDIPFSSAAHNLGVIFHSQLALKEQVNKLCQLAYTEIRRIGSIRQYIHIFCCCCCCFLKPPKLSFPVLFSLCLMLSLLALLSFPLIKLKEWETAQLTSSSKLLNLPTSLLYSTISTGYQSAARFNTK